MTNGKRILIGSLFGLLTGIICYLGGRFALKDQISTTMLFYILVNRTLIGFVIGVSSLRLHWTLHGMLMGTIVGLPFAVGCLLEQDNLETALAALVLGALYGLFVELFTTVVFRAVPHPERAAASASAEAEI